MEKHLRECVNLFCAKSALEKGGLLFSQKKNYQNIFEFLTFEEANKIDILCRISYFCLNYFLFVFLISDLWNYHYCNDYSISRFGPNTHSATLSVCNLDIDSFYGSYFFSQLLPKQRVSSIHISICLNQCQIKTIQYFQGKRQLQSQ